MILNRIIKKYDENYTSKKITVKALLKSIDCGGRENNDLIVC
ncbi:hypothetical protein [uncultured Clostridium sp.]|nr:hypothetical protein [uncultured Clostridium sp.]